MYFKIFLRFISCAVIFRVICEDETVAVAASKPSRTLFIFCVRSIDNSKSMRCSPFSILRARERPPSSAVSSLLNSAPKRDTIAGASYCSSIMA